MTQGRFLIGHTGFVGSNLVAQQAFDACFHSKNMGELRGAKAGTIMCAGLPAAKWLANKDPDADWANIESLQAILGTVEAERFVLISTIDVYPAGHHGANEGAVLDGLENHAYGRHRLAFERFIAARFPKHTILRLPGLYGTGLKKNVIYDLLNDNCLEMINPESRFQWYGLDRLSRDIERAVSAGLSVVNLMTEPVPTRAILERFFPTKAVGEKPSPTAAYDIRTRHDVLFGGAGGYIAGAASVLDGIGAYVAAEQAGSVASAVG